MNVRRLVNLNISLVYDLKTVAEIISKINLSSGLSHLKNGSITIPGIGMKRNGEFKLK